MPTVLPKLYSSDVIRLFQDQDFTILSRPRPRPSQVFKTKTLHLKTKTFLWCILEATEKHFLFSAVNENADENDIPFTTENENENGHSFSAEKWKWKSADKWTRDDSKDRAYA